MGIRHIALLALLCVCFMAAGVTHAEKPAALRLGGDRWPPFTEVEGKSRDAINLVESGLLRSGLRSTFSIVSWNEVMKRLANGQLDGGVAMWKTPEREAYLVFSKPYLENRLVLVARKGADVSAAS